MWPYVNLRKCSIPNHNCLLSYSCTDTGFVCTYRLRFSRRSIQWFSRFSLIQKREGWFFRFYMLKSLRRSLLRKCKGWERGFLGWSFTIAIGLCPGKINAVLRLALWGSWHSGNVCTEFHTYDCWLSSGPTWVWLKCQAKWECFGLWRKDTPLCLSHRTWKLYQRTTLTPQGTIIHGNIFCWYFLSESRYKFIFVLRLGARSRTCPIHLKWKYSPSHDEVMGLPPV